MIKVSTELLKDSVIDMVDHCVLGKNFNPKPKTMLSPSVKLILPRLNSEVLGNFKVANNKLERELCLLFKISKSKFASPLLGVHEFENCAEFSPVSKRGKTLI